MKEQYVISIMKDDVTKRYTGICETVRGLVVEADTIEEVLEIAQDLLPDMVAENLEYDMKNGLPPLFLLAKFAENRAF
jgi:hypothetical protein